MQWNPTTLADAHAQPDKQRRVQEMFASISKRYDLNNRLHSFGLDTRWRKRAVKLAELRGDETVLDVACGTGDLAFAFAKALRGGRVIGVDYTFEMLPIAVRKSSPARVDFVQGDAQALPIADASVDVVSIAFGIRNVQSPENAFAEFSRVLKPGGRMVVLEFATPKSRLISWGNRLYTHHLMPLTATLLSGDKTGAYRYLPRSIEQFMEPPQLRAAMAKAGLLQVTSHGMFPGVCQCHVGMKNR